MGWLSKLFSATNPVEDELRRRYTPLHAGLMRISEAKAREDISDLIAQIKAEARAEGIDQDPANLGDALLAKESSDQTIASILKVKRAQGVRDADIRWWWNMHYLERGMLFKTDELYRITLFLLLQKKSLSEEEAVTEIRRHNPRYGPPESRQGDSADDAPLPFELTDRINCYLERRSQTDSVNFKRDIESASSLNALIRAEIRQGKL